MRLRQVTIAIAMGITIFCTSVPVANATIAACTGRCFDVTVPVPAGVNVTSNVVRILLPAGYSSTSTRYPVIYLLCGAGGNQTEWTTSSDLINFASTMQAIFVMPDCGGAAGHPGWDSDWANGQYQWETFYISVLMPWIDSSYRTIKGRDGIAGLSMGGYGALALAARHPTLFRTVGDFSGLPDIQYPGVSIVNLGIVPKTIWGSETTNAANWTAHNPTALAANLKGISLYLSCGTGDPSLYNGPEETLAAQDHVPFVQALKNAGVPFHAGFFSGGAHTWPYFSLEAAWALPLMLADLQS